MSNTSTPSRAARMRSVYFGGPLIELHQLYTRMRRVQAFCTSHFYVLRSGRPAVLASCMLHACFVHLYVRTYYSMTFCEQLIAGIMLESTTDANNKPG